MAAMNIWHISVIRGHLCYNKNVLNPLLADYFYEILNMIMHLSYVSSTLSHHSDGKSSNILPGIRLMVN